MWYTAGNSFFFARSPVMPNRTSASLYPLPPIVMLMTAPPARSCHGGGRSASRAHDLVENRSVVSEPRKQDLVRARCDRHTLVEQRVEEAGVRALVGRAHARVVDGDLCAEEQSDERAFDRHTRDHASRVERL